MARPLPLLCCVMALLLPAGTSLAALQGAFNCQWRKCYISDSSEEEEGAAEGDPLVQMLMATPEPGTRVIVRQPDKSDGLNCLSPWRKVTMARGSHLQTRCNMPKEVSNADIKVGDNNLLNTRLRYTCRDGYKRKAGTSSLIVCVKDEATKMLHWTEPNIRCIMDPALQLLTSSPKQITSAPKTEAASPVNKESKTFTSSKQPVTSVTAEITTAPAMASTPSHARETTSPLTGPISQLRTREPARGTLATTATGIRSSKAPASVTTEDTTQRHTTATQNTHTSQLGIDKPLLETVATEEAGSTAVPTNLTTGDSTQLSTTVTHDTEVSSRGMLWSVGFPMLLLAIVAGVVLCCVWRQRVHTRQQYTITLTTFPMAPDESEQMDGTAQEDNDSNNPEHSSERTDMVSSSCVTPTG